MSDTSEGLHGDLHLVRRMRTGDERAFDAFFDEASRGLFRFAMSRLDSQVEAAEEIVQLTLTRAFKSLHTYRGEAALFTWLCAICRREIGAHWRRKHRLAREVALADEDPAVRAVLDGRAFEAQAAAAQRGDTAQRVKAALESLPEKYSDVLEWKYMEELPVEEVGRRLGLGLKAAESLLVRARQAFRSAFAATGASDEPPRTA